MQRTNKNYGGTVLLPLFVTSLKPKFTRTASNILFLPHKNQNTVSACDNDHPLEFWDFHSGEVMESIRDVMLSVGKQFLTFQRTAVPSFWGVQNEAMVSFSTNEPATQRHIPQELILFGELIICSEDTQYTTVHCMGKMQNSWMWKLMVHIIANIHVM